jgi:hypothetical protein
MTEVEGDLPNMNARFSAMSLRMRMSQMGRQEPKLPAPTCRWTAVEVDGPGWSRVCTYAPPIICRSLR